MTRTAAVVGAGIGGLATALALHRAGWSVTVRERWPEVVGSGTALGLWPEAQQALRSLGLGEELLARTTPYREALIRARSGRVLAPLPLARIERTGGDPVRMLSRTAVIDLLRTALPAGIIQTGVRITDPDALRAEHDLVVGADGFRSAVRSAYFTGRDATSARYAGFVAYRGRVDEPAAYLPHGEIWGRGVLAGVTPMEPGATNWYCALRAPIGTRFTLGELRDRLADWPDPLPAVLAATDPATLLRHDVHDLAPALRSFVHGNVVLVGDAAHAMTPSLGQGACQALVDAAALAHCLRDATALDGPAPVRSALAEYDALRRRPTQRLARASRLVGRLQLATGLTHVRDAIMRATAPLAR